NVRASCGCTAAVTSTRVVPPGSEGHIEVTFDTARDLGHKPRSITVYTNDPTQPVTGLILLGSVDADVALDPIDLYVGHLHRGESATSRARVLTAPNAAVADGPLETGGRVLTATLRSPTAGAATRSVDVSIQKDAPMGRFNEEVVVHTNSPRRPRLTL